METLTTHITGLDIHKKTIVVCVMTRDADQEAQVETHTFPSMTRDLYEMLR